MLEGVSIRELYPLALAEGEGVGTAYEYFAKRLVLRPFLTTLPHIRHILIAGLPERYGASLDFVRLAAELGARVTVVDERPAALTKLATAVADASKLNALPHVQIDTLAVDALDATVPLAGRFDLALSSEVLQRLTRVRRQAFVAWVSAVADAAALFTPNADNPSHTSISGLGGLHLNELQEVTAVHASTRRAQTGYIDMPPFPPGITRTDEQREQATSGTVEAVAMWGLGCYARAERLLPQSIRRSQSHIVYALLALLA